LMESRRKQRYIPSFNKPHNDSLDFVKTIGRLYYEKNDHRDLCRKMSQYFLEHVRNVYNISTGKLDNEFIRMLHYKSGYPAEELQQIVSGIEQIDTSTRMQDAQVAAFHQRLEKFYRETR